MTSGKEVAQPGTSVVPIVDMALFNDVRESLGPGERITLDLLERAKVPAGGGRAWETEGSPQVIDGVMILRRTQRVYWQEKAAASGGGAPPDCRSLDGVIGHGDPGGDCATCPFAQFGSGKNDAGEATSGQACAQRTDIFMLTPSSVLPLYISLPPTSHREALKYVTAGTAAKGAPYFKVRTRLGLEQAKSGKGQPYSMATFENIGKLEGDDLALAVAYREQILPFLARLDTTT